MNLKMNEKTQKWITIGMVTAAFVFINFYVILWPKTSSFTQLYKESNGYEDEIKALKAKVDKTEEFESERKFMKYQLGELNTKLPNALVPEKFLVAFNAMAIEKGVIVKNLIFTNPEEFAAGDVKAGYNAADPISKRADDFIKRLFETNDIPKVRASENEFQYGALADEKPIKVDFKYEFSGADSQVLDLIKTLEENTNRIKVNAVTITADKGKNITGIMDISFFGFKDSKIPVYDLWNAEIERGKTSLFNSADSARNLIADTNASDFNISLNPITYDAPSVIVAKSGVQGTAIYGENKGTEEVELHVSQSNGKYYYKYKTSKRFQGYSKPIEFTPSSTTDVVIKVYSRGRVSEQDISGSHLTVFNSTDKNIKTVVYGDDEARPRFSMTERK